MRFKTEKLGDFLYIKGRIGWKGLKKDEYLSDGVYRIINGEALTKDGIDWSKAGFISKERYEESPEIMLQNDDILISKDGTIGKLGFVRNLENPSTVASGIFVLRNLKPEMINIRFIYNYLSSVYFRNFIISRTEGSVIPHLYQKDFQNLYFPLPSLKEQNKIVDVLDIISCKIEINKMINNNLEQQAQAIFKYWFVDFEPFGKTMPNDWCNGTIDDLAKDIVCGKTPSTKKADYYGTDIPFITISDMHDKIYSITTERHLSLLGANSQAKKNLPKNSICVSCIGTAGLVTLVAEESQTNQQINSIIPKDGFSPYFIYLLMQTRSDTINKLGQGGSTIVNLNKSQFAKIQVTIPAISAMTDFDKIVSPIFEKVLQNQKENLCLTSLRDNLLPKLMSGELDVSNIKL